MRKGLAGVLALLTFAGISRAGDDGRMGYADSLEILAFKGQTASPFAAIYAANEMRKEANREEMKRLIREQQKEAERVAEEQRRYDAYNREMAEIRRRREIQESAQKAEMVDKDMLMRRRNSRRVETAPEVKIRIYGEDGCDKRVFRSTERIIEEARFEDTSGEIEIRVYRQEGDEWTLIGGSGKSTSGGSDIIRTNQEGIVVRREAGTYKTGAYHNNRLVSSTFYIIMPYNTTREEK